MLDINASYHCPQFQGKLMNQIWENDLKPNLGPDFGPNLVPKKIFVVFTSTWCNKLLQAVIVGISRKTNEPNLRKWQKT